MFDSLEGTIHVYGNSGTAHSTDWQKVVVLTPREQEYSGTERPLRIPAVKTQEIAFQLIKQRFKTRILIEFQYFVCYKGELKNGADLLKRKSLSRLAALRYFCSHSRCQSHFSLYIKPLCLCKVNHTSSQQCITDGGG